MHVPVELQPSLTSAGHTQEQAPLMHCSVPGQGAPVLPQLGTHMPSTQVDVLGSHGAGIVPQLSTQ